ncbi:FkbM family methyltransferase [Halioglobus maricola]|uniref:FkbM family methyltransferase n=1 Tax=Halioglobus maricola TaxID=2601894 RepID=A0A5P9NF93_9GAMM|nr:FkbM family methyltransferase [Halioglobus maricola]QFU74440.1 FkbM family methyltransferase [Halioglobus maricola]
MKDFKTIRSFGVTPRGIIHVGANTGQEFEVYRSSEARHVVYVEPISTVYKKLKEKVEQQPGHVALQAVCSDVSGEKVSFNISSNNGESSSMLGLGNHGKLYPGIKYVGSEEHITTQLDQLLADRWQDADFNVLVVDTQGADLKVLQGASRLLDTLEVVYVEIAEIRLYEGGCVWTEIFELLSDKGFSMKNMYINPKHWGNALFIKASAAHSPLLSVAPLPDWALRKKRPVWKKLLRWA